MINQIQLDHAINSSVRILRSQRKAVGKIIKSNNKKQHSTLCLTTFSYKRKKILRQLRQSAISQNSLKRQRKEFLQENKKTNIFLMNTNRNSSRVAKYGMKSKKDMFIDEYCMKSQEKTTINRKKNGVMKNDQETEKENASK